MNYLAKAKINTPVYELPGSNGNKIRTIKAGDQFNITDSKRIGLKTYYRINTEGYIFASDVVIIRDQDFFYHNYDSKNLVRRKITAAGTDDLGSVIGETNDITTNYNWLLSTTAEEENTEANTFDYTTMSNLLSLTEGVFSTIDQFLIPDTLINYYNGVKNTVEKYKDNNSAKYKTLIQNKLYGLRNQIIDFIEKNNLHNEALGANNVKNLVNILNDTLSIEDIYVLPAKKSDDVMFDYASNRSVQVALSSVIDTLSDDNPNEKKVKDYCAKLANDIKNANGTSKKSTEAIAVTKSLGNLKKSIVELAKANKVVITSENAADYINAINLINTQLGITDEEPILPESYEDTGTSTGDDGGDIEYVYDSETALNTLKTLEDIYWALPEEQRTDTMIEYYKNTMDAITKADANPTDTKKTSVVERYLYKLSKLMVNATLPYSDKIDPTVYRDAIEKATNALSKSNDPSYFLEIIPAYHELIGSIENATETSVNSEESAVVKSKSEVVAEYLASKAQAELAAGDPAVATDLVASANSLATAAGSKKQYVASKTSVGVTSSVTKTNVNNNYRINTNRFPNIFSGNILNTKLYGGNSKTNLLQGITVSDIFDGSAVDKLLDNLLGNIFGWINNKLAYVIGFSSSSILSALFKIFGTNFGTVLGYALNALFGGNVNSFLTPLSDFYNYKTVSGTKVWYNTASWSSISIERTGPIESEVQVWKSLYEADYSEVKDSITIIKQELNLDVGENKTKNIYTKFNRFRLAIPDHELNGSVGHIFFIRPDLNLLGPRKLFRTDKEPVHGFAHYTRLFTNLVKANATLAKQLTKDGFKGHNFMPLLTHACIGIDVADEVLETVETGETFVGWKYVYGTSMIKSKTAGTINVQFADDNILSVYKLLKVWTEYIHAVSHGEVFPKDEYVMKHQLDYPTSIYYILTDNTGEAILFWTKYTGAFPISTPSSNFSDSLGNRITRPNYSVQFAYSRKDDFNPLHLEELNRQSSEEFEYNVIYNKDTMRTSKTFVGPPFVDTTDGELTYRLRFRPAREENS